MPEGHTIHRAALDQRKMRVGKKLELISPQGRFSAGAEELGGQICTGIEAYGKYLPYHFQIGSALHIHLELYGQFRTAKMSTLKKLGRRLARAAFRLGSF